tara:strand:- start:862 stop:2574 length:1713 start_codon:yes stop_codon:yes gene_type:complete
MGSEGVQNSPDLARILSVPRRVWTPEAARDVVRDLTAHLRTRDGAQTLLEHQAIALLEIGIYGGAYLPLPVGSGKTLISLLASRMRPEILRPLILTRAALVEKTKIEEIEYRRNWVIAPLIRVESFERMSRVGAADFLEAYAPDMVIVDEAHALKNRSAAVTRRVFRYGREHPRVLIVAMTGSAIGTSIRDVAHIQARCLGARSPLPHNHHAIEEWAAALDVGGRARRLAPGALEALATGQGEDIRTAVCRRILETPGVVAMRGTTIDTPIEIRSHVSEHDSAQVEAMRGLRTTGETPDGELAEDAIAIWRHAREISLGFYSVWDPPAPLGWKLARRQWHAWCRDILDSNRRDLDSAEQLARHLRAHPEHYPEAAEALARWKAIEPSFRPNPKARWISGSTIDWVARYLERDRRPTIVWTDRPVVGEALRGLLGIPYFGEEGIDPVSGQYIGHARGTLATSSRAGATGHNLQAFSRNLCLDIPRSPIAWEQRIGRTHRPGQIADLISVDLLFGVREDVVAFQAAQEFAANVEALTAAPQKLCSADCTEVAAPEDYEGKKDPRWIRPKFRL